MGQRAFSSASTRSHGGIILPIPPNTYATRFPATENPISEGNRWINGQTIGVNYLDVQTTPGKAFGTNVSPSPPYNDPTAVVAGAWGPIQTAEATIIAPASSAQNQEAEVRILTTISWNRIVGYEFLHSVTNNPYYEVVRWDGYPDTLHFVSLTGGALFGSQLATGNRIKATSNGAGLLTFFADYGAGYQQIAQVTDTTYRSGNPGIGFFQHGGSQATMADFGLSSFSAWSL